MNCPKCNAEIQATGVAFCPECGARLIVPEETAAPVASPENVAANTGSATSNTESAVTVVSNNASPAPKGKKRKIIISAIAAILIIVAATVVICKLPSKKPWTYDSFTNACQDLYGVDNWTVDEQKSSDSSTSYMGIVSNGGSKGIIEFACEKEKGSVLSTSVTLFLGENGGWDNNTIQSLPVFLFDEYTYETFGAEKEDKESIDKTKVMQPVSSKSLGEFENLILWLRAAADKAHEMRYELGEKLVEIDRVEIDGYKIVFSADFIPTAPPVLVNIEVIYS